MHPRDTLSNRTLQARLEKAWAQSLGDERMQIGLWLQEFEAVLVSQQEQKIQPIRLRLERFLDEMSF
ncbi:Hsc62 [Serratia fonticola]|uniref:Hsc62 n=1 Tax=Serratia fonticola TaxID=47917 RepID=A0A4U9WQR9_SERFO|nr:Hsc62 [Serratia fonticola]